MITIFDLALGSSRQVSRPLIARGLKLSFSSDQSHPSPWLINILLVNPSDAPHVKSHQRKILTFFTASCQDSGNILTSQMKKSFSRRSPASSATADHIRPSSTRALDLEIRLTEAQNQKLSLELEVLRLRRANGSADVNTANSGTQPIAENTHKKRTVDWPQEFAPGNFSSVDYDKLELPDFVGIFWP